MNFIQRLIQKRKPEFDIEKAVGHYLLTLPRCSRKVVIASPSYQESGCNCEIHISAEHLLPWAEQHAKSVVSSDEEEQAARKALPIWLQGANKDDNSASYVPHYMHKVLNLYLFDFLNTYPADIFCIKCQAFVVDVKKQKLNQQDAGSWHWWTDVLTCPQGHELFYRENELNIHRAWPTEKHIP